jgi:hypothetical protein
VPPCSTLPANGASTLGDDPFVIKPHNLQLPNPVPPVEDKESWPEVGNSITPPTSNNGKEHAEKVVKPPQDPSKKGTSIEHSVCHTFQAHLL